MREISIILTQTNTIISRTFRLFSKKPYNHISISLSDDCSTMYSFGRKIMWFPLIGGFVKENINSGVFKMHPETKCKIYKLTVSDTEYNIIAKRLNKFLENPDCFRYSILNLFLMYFDLPFERDYYYVCSTFVAYLLWGIIPLKKQISLVTPDDYNSMDFEKIYEGKLHDYIFNNTVFNSSTV